MLNFAYSYFNFKVSYVLCAFMSFMYFNVSLSTGLWLTVLFAL